MPACPRCRATLGAPDERHRLACPSGHGAFILKDGAAALGFKHDDGPDGAACPIDGTTMQLIDTRLGRSTAEVDRCSTCGGAWLDAREVEMLDGTGDDEAARRLRIGLIVGGAVALLAVAVGAYFLLGSPG